MYVIFKKNYDHVWPSRAVTAYKTGFKGRVKQEVAEGAIAAGAATEGSADDKAPKAEKTLPGNLPASLAEPDALLPNRHVADDSDSQ